MISSDLQPQRAVFDDAPVGVMESTLDGAVRYANPEALRIVGAASYEGLCLHRLFAHPSELQVQLASRSAGVVGNYRARLIRQTDGEQVPVEIIAIPVMNNRGQVEATLAFFRYPIEEEINRVHQEADGADTVLYRVMVEVCKFIPCDMVTVSRYSEDLQHSQTLFQLYPRQQHGRVKWRKTWEEIPEMLRNEVGIGGTTLYNDIQERLSVASLRSIRESPVVKDLLAAQVQSAIRYTMNKANRHGDTLFGSVTFYSKALDALTCDDRDRIHNLPIAASVIQAFEFFDRKRESDRFRLLQRIAHCASLHAACDTVLHGLWEIFGWHHISIYRVDHAMNRIRFLASCEGGAVTDGPRYEQSSHKGVFARVIRDGNCELIRNVNLDSDFISHKTFVQAQSELCWPVMLENETTVRWIIDVLDARINAFAEEEVHWLGEVAHEIGGYMQRLSTLHFLTECMNGTSDATIVTDSQYLIKRANRAAAKLFGVNESRLVTGSLASFFETPTKGMEVLSRHEDHLGVCALRHSNSVTEVEVDISRRPLPDDIGGYIFVLKGMNEIWRTLRLELLEKTAYEIAAETRTPLIVAIETLERLGDAGPSLPGNTREKVLRYLYRVQHAYTKLTMFNPRVSREPGVAVLVDIATELRALYGNLPQEMQALVEMRIPDMPIQVLGDVFQILFVLETLLVILIRTSPESEPVRVNCEGRDGVCSVRFEGFLPQVCGNLGDQRPEYDVSADLRMAYPLVHEFVTRNRGALDVSFEAGDRRVSFALRIPLVS